MKKYYRYYLPYALRGNNKTGWELLNREYQTIPGPRIKRIHPSKTSKLSLYRKDENDISTIFIYNDKFNPCQSDANWKEYSEKLKLLLKMKLA